MGIAGTQHHWCLVSRGNLRFIMSLLITDGHCHKDTSLKGTEDFSPCVDVHPRASVYKVMSELQAHVWDLVSRHTCCVLIRENLLKQLQLSSGHTRGEPCFGTSPSPSDSGLGFLVEEHRPMKKHATCNCLQDMINVRKAVHKAFPDLRQRTKVWSSLVKGLTPFHIHRPQRCCQVKSMSHGHYNIPSQQSLSITAIAPLLNSQKVMEKYFVHILPKHTFQRLESKENRKENITTCRCLSLGQKFPLLHENHHGAEVPTSSWKASWCTYHNCFYSEPSPLRRLVQMQESFGSRPWLPFHFPCSLYQTV